MCVFVTGPVLLCDLSRPGDDELDLRDPSLLLLDSHHAHHVAGGLLFIYAAFSVHS